MSVIALLTDFGLTDHYAGAMKGVILSRLPGVRLVDISHDVSSHGVRQAAYLLWAAYKFFPAGTVFVCVVDPGVGSKRRILCVRVPRYWFLAPDNGLLDLVLCEEPIVEAVEVIRSGDTIMGLPSVQVAGKSNTFHGRDIFAPVAAALASGKRWSPAARRIHLQVPPPQFVGTSNAATEPRILHIDRFGNLITNVRLGKSMIEGLRVGRRVVKKWISFYAEAPIGKPALIIGSSGLVEIVARERSARHLLHASLETPVGILRR
jgi:S-adenosylmethionine hydrolase